MSRSDLKGDPSLTFKLTRDSFPSAPFLVLGILSISAFRRCSSSLGENDRGEKKCFRRLRTWKQVGSAQRRLDEEARAAAEAAQLRADLEAAFSFLRIL